MTKMVDWSDIVQAFAKARTVAIFPHIHADGDALGSAYALALALQGQGKEVRVCLEEATPVSLAFLQQATISTVVWPTLSDEEKMQFPIPELSVAVDCSDRARLATRQDYFYQAPETIKIDHHSISEDYAQHNVCRPEWAAVCVGIWELLQTFPAADCWKEPRIRECLYTGLLTDTGCFANSNTTADCHRVAAALMEGAGSFYWIYRQIFESRTPASLALTGRAYSRIRYYGDGRIAFLQIKEEDYAETGATPEDLEGLVTVLRGIQGVEVAALVKPGKLPHSWRVSLRSKTNCDVAAVSVLFGGGGHTKAAGFQYDGEYQDLEDNLVAELEKAVSYGCNPECV